MVSRWKASIILSTQRKTFLCISNYIAMSCYVAALLLKRGFVSPDQFYFSPPFSHSLQKGSTIQSIIWSRRALQSINQSINHLVSLLQRKGLFLSILLSFIKSSSILIDGSDYHRPTAINVIHHILPSSYSVCHKSSVHQLRGKST